MSLARLGGRVARSMRQNPRTERTGMPWSAVKGQVPRFVIIELGENVHEMILGKILGKGHGRA